jgi:hypothetical protein
VYVQRGSRLHLGRKHLRERIDARQLLTRRPGLFLRVVSHDLHQRGVHRRGRRGVVLHERVHGRGDVSFEHEPSDMRRRGQRLHRLRRRHDLRQRGVHRRGRHGIVLHERVHGWDDVCVEHESSDLCRRV